MKKIASFKGYSAIPGSTNTDTVNMYIKRDADGFYYDFNDNTFKNAGWTNKFSTLVADTDFHQKWLLATPIDLTGWNDGSYIFTINDVTLGITYNDSYYFEDHDFDSLAEMLQRAMGLTQENHYLDQIAYSRDKLASARIRLYSDAVSVGTDSNVIATYAITATYSGNDLQTYKVVKL